MAVTVGEFGAWTPIDAVQTASGYDVAWKNTANGQYTVWTTDNNGNYTGNLIGGAVSGTSYALESIEPIFNQDLNGDGTIGLITTVIQTDTNALGSTSLTEVANQYLYLDGSSGSGPALQYAGAASRPGSLVLGPRSARCRRQAAMTWPGRIPRAANTRCGPPTIMATIRAIRSAPSPGIAMRWNRSSRFSIKI